MTALFTFAGQGAQRPGMLADLPDSAAVQATLAEAADVLDRDTAELDTAAALADTETVQVALTVVGVAAARELAARGAEPSAVMGLSIGAWPAAVVADALDFADALRLVARRGALMRDAFPEGHGMAAVIGLEEAPVRALVEAARAEGWIVYVGNINSDRQIAVAGRDDALAHIRERALAAGASRVVRLDMAVPSHCELLAAPAETLAEVAAGVTFRTPRCAYFSANARRRLWRAAAVRDDLVHNMARPVYWAASARIAAESGFALAVEMPPARVLTGLHPDVAPPGEAVAVVDAGWHNAAALIARAAVRDDR
ncbi:ACP S-malonyltransferase [Salinisphaera orenii]|uniref:[acyl-carrier-protein] S-malonyltransferase n=1 Tax=Salinisphaera orenii YIM 95161 TaxID=1051139 RepID=A0A423PDM7_9GAMM|nr:acyltransferase domain-containing protein [Salinisphaera halophila]ROO23142.1 acyl transferase [Salinisphaera halophila YIM 95161]